MDNKELFAKMEQSIINYDKDEAVRLAKLALEKGIEPVMGADAMTAATSILGEAIKKSGGKAKYLATGIAGTVEGDIHIIGINLVTTFLVANGFDIKFLGTNVPSSLFVDQVKELKPDLILLSALLTTTMPNQKEVIDSLKEAGIRESVKVIVGGAPVSQDWADQIGADGYGENAGAAVEVAKKLMGV